LLGFSNCFIFIIGIILGKAYIKRLQPDILNKLRRFIEKIIISFNIEMSVTALPFLKTLEKSEFIPILKYDSLIQILTTSNYINLTFIINFINKSYCEHNIFKCLLIIIIRQFLFLVTENDVSYLH
jgi:hypothetical protein